MIYWGICLLRVQSRLVLILMTGLVMLRPLPRDSVHTLTCSASLNYLLFSS